MKLKLFASLLVSVAATSHAGDISLFHNNPEDDKELWLTVTTGSYHTNRAISKAENFHERNLGVGFEYKFDRAWRWSAGYYKNSYRNDTFYASAVWLPIRSRNGVVKFGLQAGLLTGYPQYKEGIGPGAAAILMVEGEKVGFNVMYIPAVEKSGTPVVGLQLKVRL